MASEVYNLYIRVLTPVHVGVDKSRDLTAGFDFKVEKGKLKIYDHKKIMEKVGDVNQYCNALEKGKTGVNKLLSNRNINVNVIKGGEYEISGNPGDLKRQIRDGMNGHGLLPGSSIKGALTSVLFSKLRSNHQNNPNAVLGNFHSSLNRFIHCSDVSFDRLAAYNAKIFNLQGNNPNNLLGGWKHGFNNTNDHFNPTGFTFAYETIRPGFSAPFTLRFDKNMYEKNVGQLPQGVGGFLQNSDFRNELFTILYGHTEAYLNREIDFFNEFNQAQYSGKLLKSLQRINEIHTPEAPVFRLASGSGFHSITGDWQFDTHRINGINHRRRNRGQYNGQDSSKSRRFAFDEVNHEWQFYPMGFVQIMTKEYYKDHCAEQENALVQQEAEILRQRHIAREQRIEEERLRVEEAMAPQWVDNGYLSRNRPKPIEAAVVDQIGFMMKIKPFVYGFEENFLEIRYPAGMEKGTIIIVNARLAGNNIQLQGDPQKK